MQKTPRQVSSALGSEDVAGFLVFPISSLLQRPIECGGSGTRAVIDAGAAIPAFLGMQDDRAPALVGIRDEYIDGAVVYTRIAPVAYLGIENDRSARSRRIG